MKTSMTHLTSCIALLALAACGGASTSPNGGGANTQPTPNPNYLTLAATSGGASQISGVGLATNTTNGATVVGQVSGELKHWNGKLTITNGVATFTSTGTGLQLNGVTQGTNGSTLVASPGSGIDDGFQYLTAFQSHSAPGTNGLDTLGVFGVATQTGHMPGSGNATLQGGAEAVLVTQADGTVLLTDGTATLTVNFATGKGNLTLNQFDAQTAGGATLSGSPVSAIKVVSMNITGNTMTGGNLSFNTGTAASTILGPNVTSNTQGQFFGHTGTRPSEVGGVLSASGDTGTLSGIYVAK